MAEATREINSGWTATVGRCPRVHTSSSTIPFEDSPYGSVEVAITSAQILALRATHIELVPAPGAGKVLQFLGATIIYDYAVAYSENSGNTNLVVENATGTDMSEILEATGFVDATSDQIRHMVPAIVSPVVLANEGLYLKNAGSAEMITGTSVFRVKVLYATHTTGL